MQTGIERWTRWHVFPVLALMPVGSLAAGYALFLMPLPIVELFFSYAMVALALLLAGTTFVIVVVLAVILVRRGRYGRAAGGIVLYIGTYVICYCTAKVAVRLWLEIPLL